MLQTKTSTSWPARGIPRLTGLFRYTAHKCLYTRRTLGRGSPYCRGAGAAGGSAGSCFPLEEDPLPSTRRPLRCGPPESIQSPLCDFRVLKE